MRSSIGQKLGWLLAAFSVLAALVLGYLTYSAARDMVQERSQRTLQRTAQVLSTQLQTGLDNVGRDARVLAELARRQAWQQAGGTPAQAALPAPGQKVLEDAFRASLQARPAYLQIRLIGASRHGLELVRVQRRGDAGLERVRDEDLQEKSHFPFVYEALGLAPGQVYLSDLGANHEDPQAPSTQAIFSVAAPVEVAGQVVGVLVLRIDANAFLGRVGAHLPEPYGFYLANRWGDYLAHPERSKVYGFERGQRALVQEEFAQTAALLQGSVRELSFMQTAGDARAFAFVKVPLPQERFFLMGLSESMTTVQADLQELASTMLKMLLVLALVALLLASWVSRVVTRPLRAVIRAAEAFSGGRTHGPLPVQRQDELGDLARGFDSMETQIKNQMQELNRSRDAMAHLAHHDALTGLANRRRFAQQLDEALARAQRNHKPCALVFVDLDDFKSINDRLGHGVGDAVLQAAARAIVGAVRQVDAVARLAGDEFTVLCENLEGEEAVQRVLDKLQQAFAEPLLVEGRMLRVRASMGASLYPRDGQDAHSLLASADAAMYRAKQQRSTW